MSKYYYYSVKVNDNIQEIPTYLQNTLLYYVKMDNSENPILVDRRTGARVVINANPFSLGRGLGCNYVIPSKVISRTHCVLEKHDGQWILVDTSTNGTYVNDKLVKSTKSPPLNENALITLDLGDHSYTFHLSNSNNDGMDDISDEQLCLFADSVLNDVQAFEAAQNEDDSMVVTDVPDIAPSHPLHDHVGMVKSQERHHNKKPKMETPTRNLTTIDVADSSTNSVTEGCLAIQPGPSTEIAEKAPVVTVHNLKNSQNNPQPQKEHTPDNYEVMENELQCAICSELFIKAVTLNCAHTYCKYCIELWKKTKSECPICRTKISGIIATLVLDNVIEKVVEGSSEEVKEHRKQVLEEREKLQNPPPPPAPAANDNTARGRNRARRGRGRNATRTRRNAGENAAPNVDAIIQTVIELSSDSNSDWEGDSSSNTESDDTSQWRDEYVDDDWYDEGVPGAYYGGYGYCFSCGRRGHWANGCPYR